jgi:hypothetical protein
MAQDRPDELSPIDSAVYLVDVSKISLKQAWSLRSYAQDISQLLATCYPEVIDRVYVSTPAGPFTISCSSCLEGFKCAGFLWEGLGLFEKLDRPENS